MRLARTMYNGAPAMVVRGKADALATVDGHTFSDLPDLLAAAQGEAGRIESAESIVLQDSDLLCPLARPRKIVCIGLNYRAHAAESGMEPPAQPVFFPKWDNGLTGPFDDVPLPAASSAIDWEAELAFVFGRRCRNVAARAAGSVVFGYTAANDVSMRDFQFHTSQWGPGKCWDRATPVGPVVVSEDELGGAHPNLAIRGLLNGKVVQESRTDDLIFDVGAIVEYLTRIMTMEPGDIVLTGTPSGVGNGQKPPVFLKDGDMYEVAIEGIGSIRNRFVRG
jgi:acylpyruvate hydrolase